MAVTTSHTVCIPTKGSFILQYFIGNVNAMALILPESVRLLFFSKQIALKERILLDMEPQIQNILDEIKKVIIGKDEIISKVLMAMLSGGHVLLDDVPGVGKTTLALSFRKVLGLDYKRVQLTSDSMPSDIVGFSVYNKEN